MKRLAVLLVSLLSLFCFSHATYSQAANTFSKEKLYLQPCHKAKVITELNTKEEVIIIDSQEDWAKVVIVTTGQVGWIYIGPLSNSYDDLAGMQLATTVIY